jgi:HSP20 family protein
MRDFPDFFADFEKEFSRMQGMINRIMEDAMKHAASPQRGEPFVYGFSMRVGPDGVPQLQPFGSSFGNAPGAPEVTEGEAAREPLTDVIAGDADVAITVELPGAEKQDVSLHVAEDVVTVRVDKGKRYHKRIQLPAPVVASTAKATFKNGILDVTIQKKEGGDPGRKVAID